MFRVARLSDDSPKRDRPPMMRLKPGAPRRYCEEEEKKREIEANGTVEATWDFVIRRVDGSECALHPDLKKNSITYREVRGPDREQVRTIAPLVPKAGPGKSDGPGTFRNMVRQTEDTSLRWDISTFARCG